MADDFPELALGFTVCRHCNFVSPNRFLLTPSVPCPRCGVSDVRGIFPEFTPIWLHNSASLFHDTVQQRAQQRLETVTAQLSRETGKEISPSQVGPLEARVRSVYEHAGEERLSADTWGKMAQAAASELSVHETVGMKVAVLLMRSSSTFEESTASVVITCAFLESMLANLLVLLADRHGTPFAHAQQQVDALRGFGTKHTDPNTYMWYFHTKSGLFMVQEFQRIHRQPFWQDWSKARTERDAIMHGKKAFPPTTTIPRVASLLENAIPVFAELQNELCCKAATP